MTMPLPDASAYDFFQAIRILQRHWSSSPRIGYANLPKDEPLRLGQKPSLTCPATLIERLDPPTDEKPAKMVLTYHGILGANGPLPLNFTEYALDRAMARKDRTFPALLDVFHHRMMSFLARAWADNNLAVDLDRPADSHFIRYFGGLIGIGQDSLRNRDLVPDYAKLYFSGWLSREARSPEGLGKILAHYFAIPTTIKPFQGRWLPLPAEHRSRLGGSPDSGVLGESVILGESVWDCCLSFRIVMGPLKFSSFQRMLPGGQSFARLCSWVKNYVGDEFFWDVAFQVEAPQIPLLMLGSTAQLGYNTWLRTGKNNTGVFEVVFESRAA